MNQRVQDMLRNAFAKHVAEVKTTLSRWSVWCILLLAGWEGPAKALLDVWGDYVPSWFKQAVSVTIILAALIAAHIPQSNLRIVRNSEDGK